MSHAAQAETTLTASNNQDVRRGHSLQDLHGAFAAIRFWWQHGDKQLLDLLTNGAKIGQGSTEQLIKVDARNYVRRALAILFQHTMPNAMQFLDGQLLSDVRRVAMQFDPDEMDIRPPDPPESRWTVMWDGLAASTEYEFMLSLLDGLATQAREQINSAADSQPAERPVSAAPTINRSRRRPTAVGLTKSEIIDYLDDHGILLSPSGFDRARREAKVASAEKGGKGIGRRYNAAEIRSIADHLPPRLASREIARLRLQELADSLK